MKAAGAIESSDDDHGPWPGEDDVTLARVDDAVHVRDAKRPWIAVALGAAILSTAILVAWVVSNARQDDAAAVAPAASAPSEPDPVISATAGVMPTLESGGDDDASPPVPSAPPSVNPPSKPIAPIAPSSATPEPSTTPKPSVSQKPSPKPSTSPKKPAASPPNSEDPSPSDSACVAAREAASRAASKLAWREVLQNTAQPSCWASSSERLRLRVEAFAELGRFEDCVRAGGSTSDAKVAKISDFCRKRLDAG